MFGHQNNTDQANSHVPDPSADDALGTHEPETIAPTPATSAPTVTDSVSGYEMTDVQPPVVSTPSPTPASPMTDIGLPTVHSTPAVTPLTGDAGDLIGLKQSALQELSPLIGHLEQTPEEKFRTTMMMIQASDDQSMLQTAFAAAKEITDEKARAQALLDVVNEINYFTQQHSDAS